AESAARSSARRLARGCQPVSGICPGRRTMYSRTATEIRKSKKVIARYPLLAECAVGPRVAPRPGPPTPILLIGRDAGFLYGRRQLAGRAGAYRPLVGHALAGISHRSLRAVTWRGHSCLPGCPLGRALLPTLPSTQCHSSAHVSRCPARVRKPEVSTRQAECLRHIGWRSVRRSGSEGVG